MSLRRFYPQLHILQELAAKKRLRVYLVGGFLRDLWLGRSGTDIDFTVRANAIALARIFARRIKGAFVLLDAAHGCARVAKKQDSLLWTFDFADFRAKDIKGDMALRDLTVNALCADVSGIGPDDNLEKHILDVHGARRDFQRKVIRMVAPRAFKDDPLRLLRAFSVQAATGFKIEAKTLARIKKDVPLITGVSMERVREEMFKIFASPRAAAVLSAMDKIGLLAKVMPQITVMYGIKQGGYHHLDVWQHSLEVVRQLEQVLEEVKTDEQINAYLQQEIAGGHKRYALLKFAALLHDIGKPDTRKKEDTRITFHGHEHVGERIARAVTKHLKLSVKERYFLEDAVRRHLRPGYLSNFKRPTAKAIFRYFRDTKEEAAGIALLAIADQRSTCGSLTTAERSQHHLKICQMLIRKYFEVLEQKPLPRLLTGHDLIKVLKLKPSPLFAEILGKVQEAQALGKITTKQEALALARVIV